MKHRPSKARRAAEETALPASAAHAEAAAPSAQQSIAALRRPEFGRAARAEAALALQRTAGNGVVGGVLVQRDNQAKHASTQRPPRSLSTVIGHIGAKYKQIFQTQSKALDNLKSDLSSVELNISETVLLAAVEIAISASIRMIGSSIASTASPIAAGLIVAASSSLASKSKELVSSAYQIVDSQKPLRTRFIQGQEGTLSNYADIIEDNFYDHVAPGFEALPDNERVGVAEEFLDVLRASKPSAWSIQYLSSLAEWGNLLRQNSQNPDDLTTNLGGVLRIHFETNGGLSGALRITSARIEEMDQDVSKRIKNTPALRTRKLREWPITKVFVGPAWVEVPHGALTPMGSDGIRYGGDWLMRRAHAKGQAQYTDDQYSDPNAILGAAIYFAFEFGDISLQKLGDLSD